MAGQKTPEMQNLLDVHQTPFFELVDKYFECRAESIFNDLLAFMKQKCIEFMNILNSIWISFRLRACQFELEVTATLFKLELEKNIPDVSICQFIIFENVKFDEIGMYRWNSFKQETILYLKILSFLQ